MVALVLIWRWFTAVEPEVVLLWDLCDWEGALDQRTCFRGLFTISFQIVPESTCAKGSRCNIHLHIFTSSCNFRSLRAFELWIKPSYIGNQSGTLEVAPEANKYQVERIAAQRQELETEMEDSVSGSRAKTPVRLTVDACSCVYLERSMQAGDWAVDIDTYIIYVCACAGARACVPFLKDKVSVGTRCALIVLRGAEECQAGAGAVGAGAGGGACAFDQGGALRLRSVVTRRLQGSKPTLPQPRCGVHFHLPWLSVWIRKLPCA